MPDAKSSSDLRHRNPFIPVPRPTCRWPVLRPVLPCPGPAARATGRRGHAAARLLPQSPIEGFVGHVPRRRHLLIDRIAIHGDQRDMSFINSGPNGTPRASGPMVAADRVARWNCGCRDGPPCKENTRQQIVSAKLPSVAISLIAPREPVADLGVGRKQKHVTLSRRAALQRKDQARVVRVADQIERERLRRAEPIGVDAPPR